MLNPDTPISTGYHRLVQLMHLRRMTTVLTANFDDCISKARNEINRPHHIDIVKTPSDFTKISATPPYPLLVYLHGAVENYTDKNVIEEVEKMDQGLVDSLIPILKDHPLVVIGYRGAESSIMKHLLIDSAGKADNYKNGIYWCFRKGESLHGISDYLKFLGQTIGNNLQFVEIESFDHLFDKVIWPFVGEAKLKIEISKTVLGQPDETDESLLTFDLKSAKPLEAGDFEDSLLKVRVANYCKKLNIKVPDIVSDDWLKEQMSLLNLIRRDKEGVFQATNAGILLFSKIPQIYVPSAKVIIRFIGNENWLKKILGDEYVEGSIVERSIEGNLWYQLNEISNALSLINRPFRLKNEKSDNVLPYDPIALKEIVVNSLVHCDYTDDETNVVEIYPDKIFVRNPGGLTEDVKAYFDEELMQEEIRKGRRGIKGYRNPAIADLFYSSGDMDKKGSGLYDVVTRVQQNSGYVEFAPDQQNTQFAVTIRCRPEAIDEVTNTAASLNVITTKFSTNIIEFKQLPNTVWFAPSKYATVLEIFEAHDGDTRFPPFLFLEKRFTVSQTY